MKDITRIQQETTSIQQLKLQHELALQRQEGKQVEKQEGKQEETFGKIFKQSLQNAQELQISKHAVLRMNERGINYADSLKQDVEKAVEKARTKGAKDVVIIGRDSAFIVNVQNNTLITTMSAHEMREHIFTNIDSAVLI